MEEIVLGERRGLLVRPAKARWLYVLAHGAGAGMRHAFMAEIAEALAAVDVATLRWEFPYMAAGRPRPDGPAVAHAAEPLDDLRGLAFLGFPLHPPDRPGTERAEHLARTAPAPLLFVQGTRDELATPALLRPVVARLGRRARLHVVEHADHGFEVLVRSGRAKAEVMAEVAGAVAAWMARVAGPAARRGSGSGSALSSRKIRAGKKTGRG